MANVQIASNPWNSIKDESGSKATFGTKLSRIRKESGRSYVSLLKELITLRIARGRLSFDEYVKLRLYDNTLYRNTDKKAFVGFKVLQRIWIKANYRFDFFGLVNNKIATDIMLGTYGFPIMPTVAIFREQVGRSSPFFFRSEEELRSFLTKNDHYPLFSKPISGHQSHGTASLDRYDAEHNRLITTNGYGIPLDMFIAFVKEHGTSGYIFQKRMSPQIEIQKICGNRLATVRLLTILIDGKPKILRACWKIPAGNNIADNFWRPGNLLAQLDLNSGRVLRVIRGSGMNFEEVTHHPETGVNLIGMVIPNWQAVVVLAHQGAEVIQELGLIGWDIASIDSGAVIVEINETPDFNLHQLTDQCGLLDSAFMNFLASRKKHAEGWLKKSSQKQRIVTELVPPPGPISSVP